MNRQIAHIVNQYLPRSENWIYNQIRALPQLDSIVITPRRIMNREVFPLENIFSFAEQHPFVRFYNRCYQKVCCTQIYPFYLNACRRHDVGLLHAHFGFTAAYHLGLKEHLNIPLVTTFYGYDLKKVLIKEPLLKDLYPKLFEVGDRFLVEGPTMKETLAIAGCPPDKITVQRLGVPIETLPQTEVVSESGRLVRILMTASFRLKKGHEHAIKAFAILCQRQQNVQLDLIGGGPLESDLRQLVRSLSLEDRVQFHGFKNREELNGFIRKTHIFLHPSIETPDGDTEGGSPVVITEAAAAGIPVVSTRHADIPEIVIHGKSGLLCKEKDIDSLAANLETLVENPQTRAIMGAHAREHVLAKFNLTRQGQILENLYSELMDR